jgi:hypothetical protein
VCVGLCPEAQERQNLSELISQTPKYSRRKIVLKSISTQMATMRNYEVISETFMAFLIRI